MHAQREKGYSSSIHWASKFHRQRNSVVIISTSLALLLYQVPGTVGLPHRIPHPRGPIFKTCLLRNYCTYDEGARNINTPPFPFEKGNGSQLPTPPFSAPTSAVRYAISAVEYRTVIRALKIAPVWYYLRDWVDLLITPGIYHIIPQQYCLLYPLETSA